MEALAVVTALAVLQIVLFAAQVGAERNRHKIDPPAMTGQQDFDRMFRIHQNSVENIVVFLPALWLFGYYVQPLVGAGLGLVYIIGRFVYRNGYMKDPQGRLPGFFAGLLATAILAGGGLIGAIIAWVRSGSL